MTGRLHDTWAERDFPVLLAAARLHDQRAGAPGLTEDLVAAEAGMEAEDVVRALAALDGTYLTIKVQGTSAGTIFRAWVLGLTERGRRTAALWPSGEGVDALVGALNQAAEESTDEEDRNWLRRTAGGVGQVSRGVMTDVLAAVISKQING